MNLNTFLQLAQGRQTTLLYHHGIYIGKRKEGNKAVVLYQLHQFYVEVCYLKYRQSIVHLRCFTSTDILNPYLAQIDVEELIRCAS